MATATKPDVEQLTCEVELLKSEESLEESGKKRRYRMLANSGGEVMRWYGRAVFDLEGIEHKQKCPNLLGHDESKIAGYADEITKTKAGLELAGYVTKATEAGREVANLAADGFPWEASIGVGVLSREEVEEGVSVEVNGQTFTGPISVIRKSRLLEVSFVTAGADKNTAAEVLAAQTKEKHPMSESTKTDPRHELKSFLEAFPGREGWAAQLYASGKTLEEARGELNEVLAKELDEERAKRAAAEKAAAEQSAKLSEIEELKKKARHPGVGFNGEAREAAGTQDVDPSKLSPDERWERDPKLRAEFFGEKALYAAFLKRHPQEA